jgi:glutathione S-transferase
MLILYHAGLTTCSKQVRHCLREKGLDYLDEAFPAPRLSPADPKARARMRLWTWTADDAHLQGARLTRNRKLKASVEEMSTTDIALVLEHMPVPARRERWQQQTMGGHSESEMDTAMAHMRFVAARMEDDLAHGPWLAGATFSLADISMASLIHRTLELFPDAFPPQQYARLNDWYARLMARPAAKFVYTAGTAETPKIPPGRTVAGIAEYRIPISP